MDLSIIIVTYKTPGLPDTLHGLLGPGSHVGSGWEVIVVDNDERRRAAAELSDRFPQVSFVANEGNLGFAHGCNLGADLARGRILLFLNPDVLAEPRQIQALLAEKAAHPDVAILTALQVDEKGKIQKAFDTFPTLLPLASLSRRIKRVVRPTAYPDPRGPFSGMIDCDWAAGSIFLIEAECLHDLGGWDEDYWLYIEDTDLCRKAKERGLRVAFTPRARFVHAHGGASRRNPATAAVAKTEVIASKHVYIKKHYEGLARVARHTTVAVTSMAGLLATSALNVITVGRVEILRVRHRMLGLLASYYARRVATGDWRSIRSAAYAGPVRSDRLYSPDARSEARSRGSRSGSRSG